uniref:Uncharacterized protein n=1 Tax=Davidia involucrata TaxID=16924 RepID=A0A5B6Z2V9_DAVIN
MDEYVKAYYAALLQRQREQEETAKWQQELSNTNISNGVYGTSSECQVGMKSKQDEGDDDVEWEEAPPAGNTGESYKVNDLNVQADGSGDDEDDIDWEEG